MAIDQQSQQQASGGAGGRRMMIGTNVALAIGLVVGIVAVVQAIAYSVTRRVDMTSSRINSLSDGTDNLLSSLDANVRLTSFYFATDLEEEDQQRYRQAATDLIELYEATNRGKVIAEWINPIQDHEKKQKLIARLRAKPAFKDELEAYEERVDEYKNNLDGRMQDMVQAELALISGMGGGLNATEAPVLVTQIEAILSRWTSQLTRTRQEIDAYTTIDRPQYTDAVNTLRSVYASFSKVLEDVAKFAAAEAARNPNLPEDTKTYLRDAGVRFSEHLKVIDEEKTKVEALAPLKIDELFTKLGPTTNPIIVETDDTATVVEFASVWPTIDPQRGGQRVAFKNRAFKGEEKLTAAILRATYQEQTAVVFVRYGGPPLMMGGFMPGQPPAPYAEMAKQMEDANFIVKEWDLKASDDPPEIDPPPTRIIYVVLKPTPPQRGQFGQPSQEPPFTDKHKQLVLDAIGENGRALFVGGWAPGPFGPIPSTYEYNGYLKDNWGIEVDTSALLIKTVSMEPGKYVVTGQDFQFMRELLLSEHDIVASLGSLPIALPGCAPLAMLDSPPEGVTHTRLITQPARDGIWGVKNIQAYGEQLNERRYMTLIEGDLEGPFLLAAAAQKGDAKVVVVSSRNFAEDGVAFARQLAMTSQGITVRSSNPGNVTLFVNAMHWLNDNTQFMNIGQPIDAAVLSVDRSTVKKVQVFTIVAWPLLALCGGGVAWWVRRR